MPVPREACRDVAVVDRFDLWRERGHAIWLSDGAVRIESARDRQADRPWVTKR
jgi:hypothetical protein